MVLYMEPLGKVAIRVPLNEGSFRGYFKGSFNDFYQCLGFGVWPYRYLGPFGKGTVLDRGFSLNEASEHQL